MATRKVWGLRTNYSNNTSYKGFQWPTKGKVKAPDWKKEEYCGNGLHALEKGTGNSALLNWSIDAVWMVVEYDARYKIDLKGKVKFPSCSIIYSGNRAEATQILYRKYGNIGIHGLVYHTDKSNETIVGGNHCVIHAGGNTNVTVGSYSKVNVSHNSSVCIGYGSVITLYGAGRITTKLNFQEDITIIHPNSGQIHKPRIYSTSGLSIDINGVLTVDNGN